MNPFLSPNFSGLTVDNPLLSTISKEEIIQRTALQLISDFDKIGERISYSGNISGIYDELSLQMQPILKKLLKEGLPPASLIRHEEGNVRDDLCNGHE